MMLGGELSPQGQRVVVYPDNEAGSKEWALTGSLLADTTKDTLCRNVTIYGHCRYENKGIGKLEHKRRAKD